MKSVLFTGIVSLGVLGLSSVATAQPLGMNVVAASLAPKPKLPGASLLGGVVGCEAPGAKQGVGALAGGAVGGLAANKLVKGNKTVGTIAGAGVGAAAGSYIGCKVQVGDRNRQLQAQEAAARQAAPRAAPPVERVAEVDEGDAPYPQPRPAPTRSASAHAEPASGAGRMARVRFNPGVTPAASYSTATSGDYVAGRMVSVRAEPRTGARVLGTLQAEDHVDVIAALPDSPWLLVGHGSTAEGYASASSLQRSGAAVAKTRVAAGCRIVREITGAAGAGQRVEDLKACPLGDGSWSLSKL